MSNFRNSTQATGATLALICATCHNPLPLAAFYTSKRGTPFRHCKACTVANQRSTRHAAQDALRVHEGLEPVAQRFCALQWSRS